MGIWIIDSDDVRRREMVRLVRGLAEPHEEPIVAATARGALSGYVNGPTLAFWCVDDRQKGVEDGLSGGLCEALGYFVRRKKGGWVAGFAEQLIPSEVDQRMGGQEGSLRVRRDAVSGDLSTGFAELVERLITRWLENDCTLHPGELERLWLGKETDQRERPQPAVSLVPDCIARTLHGKESRFDIVEEAGAFHVYRNGLWLVGPYSSVNGLRDGALRDVDEACVGEYLRDGAPEPYEGVVLRLTEERCREILRLRRLCGGWARPEAGDGTIFCHCRGCGLFSRKRWDARELAPAGLHKGSPRHYVERSACLVCSRTPAEGKADVLLLPVVPEFVSDAVVRDESVEPIQGNAGRFDVFKAADSSAFYVYRDGLPYRGPFATRPEAVAFSREQDVAARLLGAVPSWIRPGPLGGVPPLDARLLATIAQKRGLPRPRGGGVLRHCRACGSVEEVRWAHPSFEYLGLDHEKALAHYIEESECDRCARNPRVQARLLPLPDCPFEPPRSQASPPVPTAELFQPEVTKLRSELRAGGASILGFCRGCGSTERHPWDSFTSERLGVDHRKARTHYIETPECLLCYPPKGYGEAKAGITPHAPGGDGPVSGLWGAVNHEEVSALDAELRRCGIDFYLAGRADTGNDK